MPLQAGRRLNSAIKKLSRQDIFVLKIDIIAFTLLMAALFPVLTSAHRGWYIGIVLICEVYLASKIFGKKIGK